MKLTLELEAVPLGRPRVTKCGTFLPARSQKFRANLQLLVRAAFHGTPYDTPLIVTLHFYKPRSPAARNYGDIDNLAKAVLDACNGLIWKDDALIEELHCYKHRGAGKIELEVIDIEED